MLLTSATIVFREVLEIALILGIVMATTRGMAGRVVIALSGLALGLIGAGVIALFTDAIAQAVDGVGQEILNAFILFIAVIFLGWTVLWMKKHGRTLSREIGAISKDVMDGRKSFFVLIGVIAFATFREGSEIVLFTYGMWPSDDSSRQTFIAGCALGLVGGVAVGFMLYYGLLKAFKRHLFTVTSWMLIVLTAGMAAKGAGFLIAAGILPELHPQVWDSSAILAADGLIGETLSILIGYTARPTGMELAFYLATLGTLTAGYLLIGRTKHAAPQPPQNIAMAE